MNIRQTAGLQQSQEQNKRQYAILHARLARENQLGQASVLDSILQQRQSYLLGVEKPESLLVSLEEYMRNTEGVSHGDYLTYHNESFGYKMSGDGPGYRPDIPDDRNKRLADPDTAQTRFTEIVSGLNLSEVQREIAELLIGAADDRGFIVNPDEEHKWISRTTGYDQQEIASVHQFLKHNAEPVGILTEGPREVLMLKINKDETFALERDIALEILDHHYHDLAALNFDGLKKTGLLSSFSNPEVMIDSVNQYIESFLPTVEGFQKETISQGFSEPDLIAHEEDGKYRVVSNKQFQPRVKFDAEALQSFREAIGKNFESNPIYKQEVSTLEFVNKLQDDSTRMAEKVATVLLNNQQQFLSTENKLDLNPVLVKDLAEKFEVSPSTISSIITNKIVQMPDGRDFRLRELLDLGITQVGDERTQVPKRVVQEKIRSLIGQETITNPVTDIQLHKVFKQEGYIIGTTMIRKLREAMNIPAAKERMMSPSDQGIGLGIDERIKDEHKL